jgi:2'-5' RNA ligase
MAIGGERSAGQASATDPVPLRVFFALWPDAPAHERIAAMAADVVARAGGRAPRPENIHLTVAFVGSVARDRIAALKRIGASAARTVAPFTLELDRLGAFHHAGIAWLGADVLPTELEDLVFALREQLAAKSFPVEKRLYRAHMTLARRCGTMASIRIAPIAWRIEGLTLNASKLSPSGSRYTELAEWPLG